MAEACRNRTYPARIRRHAGFEDQEGHQAQSASRTWEESRIDRGRDADSQNVSDQVPAVHRNSDGVIPPVSSSFGQKIPIRPSRE